jgi:hypothetical protein
MAFSFADDFNIMTRYCFPFQPLSLYLSFISEAHRSTLNSPVKCRELMFLTGRRNQTLYSIRDALHFVKEFKQVGDDPTRRQQWQDEQRTALIDRRMVRLHYLFVRSCQYSNGIQHAYLCETWYQERATIRTQEIKDMRQRRRDA